MYYNNNSCVIHLEIWNSVFQDYEQEVQDTPLPEDTDHLHAGWQTVDIDTRPVDLNEDQAGALEDEPTIDGGLAAALMLAQKKGEFPL